RDIHLGKVVLYQLSYNRMFSLQTFQFVATTCTTIRAFAEMRKPNSCHTPPNKVIYSPLK
ncbi:hypothetical protein, partial [Rothia sp. (in: high G+C Gram-positive bacteria)]|uniref:hypothetical protein n=1 Tax=Rothia sp. (in: high G+C Gram-positive bacteria) TaxID=1885016 RepID=UPI0025FD2967